MEIMIGAMHESNELMKKLTDQLEIISLPPDMVKWAQEKKYKIGDYTKMGKESAENMRREYEGDRRKQ